MKGFIVILSLVSVSFAGESYSYPDNLEYVNSRVMERLRQEAGSERGLYHVFLPDGRLQRVQYTAAPVRPAAQVPSSVFQDSQRNTYYVQVPTERLQALTASSRLGSLQQNYQQNEGSASYSSPLEYQPFEVDAPFVPVEVITADQLAQYRAQL